MDTPRDLRYTQTHEWVRYRGKVVTVGLTDYAQDQLSDLTYVELPTEGDSFSAQDQVAVVESVKTASDVYAPISGSITEVNKALLDKPELINADPYGEGWIFKMIPDDVTELENLMDADEYDRQNPDEDN
ncbi:MAG: glycine cleavage system protein GcvH [Kiritimatiellae bacterium]|nr:glycine cleavage system protein GcvH [Kiritimatiellia bacterium]MCO5060478.1 glycine cleavage system protein GcvH [Kiritimatiellia bacterium]MCO6400675.1 glycine cleavage system protein GcvH [Verrucomicrobiota bacterium]